MLELEHIQQAHERIKDAVRRTPCLRTRFFHSPAVDDASLSLKLECLQVSGSFKARGASNKVLTLTEEARRRGLVTASGGNHGLGVAYAGRRAGSPGAGLPARVHPGIEGGEARALGRPGDLRRRRLGRRQRGGPGGGRARAPDLCTPLRRPGGHGGPGDRGAGDSEAVRRRGHRPGGHRRRRPHQRRRHGVEGQQARVSRSSASSPSARRR